VKGAAVALALALSLAAAVAQAQEGEVLPPFVTTPEDVVMRMLRLAQVGSSDYVVDLGSGDGRIVIAAAREFGARGLGIELDPGLVEKARASARAAGVSGRASFVEGDVLHTDFSRASVVTVYLLPQLMNRLQPLFLERLEPGTRIVSHSFLMTSWKPDRSETLRIAAEDRHKGGSSTLYLWIVPANVRGEWRGGGWRVALGQTFQELEAEASFEGRAVASVSAQLSGRAVSLRAPGVSFEGRVDGNRIAGELDQGGKRTPLVLQKIP
jgi:SAM-dependent methyltransferase